MFNVWPIFLSSHPAITAFDHWGERVAAPQSSPQTVRTDSAVGGACRDQCGQAGSLYMRRRWWVGMSGVCVFQIKSIILHLPAMICGPY